uniref:sulfoquinovosidase-like n=1 Tax=Styela clava TaxID=7725 RepID=UPI0019397036|nr:sulfoquinovosidase-like [Styela clava]
MRIVWVTILLFQCVCEITGKGCQQIVFEKTDTSVEIFIAGKSVIKHSQNNPIIEVGKATSSYKGILGNFYVNDDVTSRIPLEGFKLLLPDETVVASGAGPVSGTGNNLAILFFSSKNKTSSQVEMKFSCEISGNIKIHIDLFDKTSSGKITRLWIKMYATESEKVYGGGEQFTYFQMRGHAFPIWVREQGVSRDYKKLTTHLAEIIGNAGGDYHTTYWTQATYVSSRLLYVHVNHSYYNVLNFTSKAYHELELWEDVSSVDIYVDVAKSWPELLTKLTGFFGRQPKPPKWLYDGAILGIQGGKNEAIRKYELLKEQGVKISGIWIQDWPGKFHTSLGKRVYWNWELNEEFYWPLDVAKERFQEYLKEGVRFLSYINPHIIDGSKMYKHADERGYFIKNSTTGKTLLVDFGEFDCGTVDLTNPEAYEWYKSVLTGMLDIGFSGWMADFGGEYLPVDDDIYFYDNRILSAGMHNYYSYLWAKLNRDAIEEAGRLEDAFVFMRSGYASSPGQTLMAWAGDQNVDYFYGDGLPSVIPATLSLGMSGMGLSHSDIGGYVSLLMMVRNEELILRWSEMSVFTQVMRTHECNRPDRNWQVYTTNRTMREFAQLTKLHSILRPYHEFVAEENHKYGWPVQRPLFFSYPNDETSYDIQYQYMYGPDLLVAPVLTEGSREWEVYFPPDDWVYLWQDEIYSFKSKTGQYLMINAPMGRPPVFYRKGSDWEKLFLQLRKENMTSTEEPQGLSWELLLSNPMIFFYLLLRKIFYYVLFYY